MLLLSCYEYSQIVVDNLHARVICCVADWELGTSQPELAMMS